MKLPRRYKRLETHFYLREDRYNIGEKIIIIDRNLIFPTEVREQYYNFTHDYSEAYYCESDGKVNTRIQFIRNNKEPQKITNIYLKLNLFQRTKLNVLARTTWFHTNRVAAWSLIISIALGAINVGILVRNSLTIPRHYQLLIDERDKTIANQIEIIHTLQEEMARVKIQVEPIPDTVLNAGGLPQR